MLESLASRFEALKGIGERHGLNSVLFFAANAITFLGNFLAARVFGPVSFAYFKSVISAMNFTGSVTDWGIGGLPTVYFPQFSRKKEFWKMQALARKVLSYRTIAYALILVGMFAAVQLKFKAFDEPLGYLALSLLVAGSFLEVFKAFCLGLEDFRRYYSGTLATSFLSAFLMVVIGSQAGVIGAVLGFGLGLILGNTFFAIYAIKNKVIAKSGSRKTFDFKKLVKEFALPSFSIGFVGALASAAVPSMNLFFKPEFVGYYAFASVIYAGIGLFPGFVSNFALPKFSGLIGAGELDTAKRIMKRALMIYTGITIAGLAFLVLAVPGLIAYFLPAYSKGIITVVVLNSFAFLAGFGQIFEAYYGAKKDFRKLSILFYTRTALFYVVSYVAIWLAATG
jgi:O-antigen/teichoic acid export membrane protein